MFVMVYVESTSKEYVCDEEEEEEEEELRERTSGFWHVNFTAHVATSCRPFTSLDRAHEPHHEGRGADGVEDGVQGTVDWQYEDHDPAVQSFWNTQRGTIVGVGGHRFISYIIEEKMQSFSPFYFTYLLSFHIFWKNEKNEKYLLKKVFYCF